MGHYSFCKVTKFFHTSQEFFLFSSIFYKKNGEKQHFNILRGTKLGIFAMLSDKKSRPSLKSASKGNNRKGTQ